jgi:hypothetical protein
MAKPVGGVMAPNWSRPKFLHRAQPGTDAMVFLPSAISSTRLMSWVGAIARTAAPAVVMLAVPVT